jgi:hypothetical protein
MPYGEDPPRETGRFHLPIFVVRPGGGLAAFHSEGELERHLDLEAAADGSVAYAADGQRLRLARGRRWDRAYYVVPIPCDVVRVHPAEDRLPRVAELKRALLEFLARRVEEPAALEQLALHDLVQLGVQGARPPPRLPWQARPWA